MAMSASRAGDEKSASGMSWPRRRQRRARRQAALPRMVQTCPDHFQPLSPRRQQAATPCGSPATAML